MTKDRSSGIHIVPGHEGRQEWLAGLPLREYFVDRGPIVEARQALQASLPDGTERDIQRILENHPGLLVHRLSCEMGWVIPQKRLGSEYVTDFLVAEELSPGFYWLAVELESPQVRMFTKAGDPSQHLVHAIRQIQDWRSWLEHNQAYAARPREEDGLGLVDISPRLPGLIIIGRRSGTKRQTRNLRRQLMADHRIEIRSYDSLITPSDAMPLYRRFGDTQWGR